MTISYLPADLFEEIFSNVPATSLVRLRSTCKQWNALFKDPKFIEKHLRNATKQSLVLMLKDYRVRRMIINLNVAAPSIELKDELSLKDPRKSNMDQVKISTVIHCDGLLLCTTMDDRVVVWSPLLGETRWIQLKTYPTRRSVSTFGLGYQNNKSCRSYKILRCWTCKDDKPTYPIEIYEFSSDSWKVLDNVFLDCILKQKTGLSLKGNTYWLAQDCDDEYLIFLLSFDFSMEGFKRLCLPPFKKFARKMVLSIVREEELSVLHENYYTSNVEIWMTNRIDSDEAAGISWMKYFTVNFQPDCEYWHIALMDEEKKVVLYCYDNKLKIIGEDGKYNAGLVPRVNHVSWLWCRPRMFKYVPSLVQIQREVEGK